MRKAWCVTGGDAKGITGVAAFRVVNEQSHPLDCTSSLFIGGLSPLPEDEQEHAAIGRSRHDVTFYHYHYCDSESNSLALNDPILAGLTR